jgi:hypothetical protein
VALVSVQVHAATPGVGQTGSGADSDATIETVEVVAQREAVREAINAFVANVSRFDGETLARWRRPICPEVSGATREQVAFVRARILEIAAAAGAPVSRDVKCRTNLYVVLTSQPDQLWQEWRARYPKMFNSESPPMFDRVLAAGRPVRAWHNAILNNADGTSPANAASYRHRDSHIVSSVAEDTLSVVIVVDVTRTGGATFGQLADYVAMASLARIDLDADYANTPTILRLFSLPAADGQLARLTRWDQAFLKALYAADETLLRPRRVVAQHMAADLLP